MPDSTFTQSQNVSVPKSRTIRRHWEWPTLVLIGVIYAGWITLTWLHTSLPWWLVLPLGGWLVAWFGSAQHEIIHGHPTPHRFANQALGWPPLALWLPYPLYRDSHMAHHNTGTLTCPVDDPESFYVTARVWQRLPGFARWILVANNTLPGRLLIGPALAVGLFLWREFKKLTAGQGKAWRTWIVHALSVAVVLYWVVAVCEIPVWQYVLMYAYPGLSLTLLRSFAEHRTADEQDHRTAICDGDPLTRLLFLNLNLHAVHHDQPGMAWYDLPAEFARREASVLERNGNYRIKGYGALLLENFLTPRDHPVHPYDRANLA